MSSDNLIARLKRALDQVPMLEGVEDIDQETANPGVLLDQFLAGHLIAVKRSTTEEIIVELSYRGYRESEFKTPTEAMIMELLEQVNQLADAFAFIWGEGGIDGDDDEWLLKCENAYKLAREIIAAREENAFKLAREIRFLTAREENDG